MTITSSAQTQQLDYDITSDSAVGIAAETDLRAGPATIYSVTITRGVDAGQSSYLKIFDSDGSSFTSGTTFPDIVIPLKAAAEDVRFVIPEGLAMAVGITHGHAEEKGATLTTASDNAAVVTYVSS